MTNGGRHRGRRGPEHVRGESSYAAHTHSIEGWVYACPACDPWDYRARHRGSPPMRVCSCPPSVEHPDGPPWGRL